MEEYFQQLGKTIRNTLLEGNALIHFAKIFLHAHSKRNYKKVLKSWNLGLVSLVSNSESAIYQPCDLGQMTSSLCVSTSPSVNDTSLTGLFESYMN